MQSVQSLRFRREVSFKPEGAKRLLHPECRFCRRSGRDAQRHHLRPVKRLRRKVFETRKAFAKFRAEFVLLLWILLKRDVPKTT